MLYFICQALLAYYEYLTQTSVTLADEWPQRFPAVTICNYSPFCYDKFIEPYLNYTRVFNLSNATDTTFFSKQQASYVFDYVQYKINQNESLTEFYYSLESMLIKFCC